MLKSMCSFLTECITKAFAKYVKETNDGMFNKCSLPWIMSALGQNSTDLPGCSINDTIKQNEASIHFFVAAKNYNVSGCKGKKLQYIFGLKRRSLTLKRERLILNIFIEQLLAKLQHMKQMLDSLDTDQDYYNIPSLDYRQRNVD